MRPGTTRVECNFDLTDSSEYEKINFIENTSSFQSHFISLQKLSKFNQIESRKNKSEVLFSKAIQNLQIFKDDMDKTMEKIQNLQIYTDPEKLKKKLSEVQCQFEIAAEGIDYHSAKLQILKQECQKLQNLINNQKTSQKQNMKEITKITKMIGQTKADLLNICIEKDEKRRKFILPLRQKVQELSHKINTRKEEIEKLNQILPKIQPSIAYLSLQSAVDTLARVLLKKKRSLKQTDQYNQNISERISEISNAIQENRKEIERKAFQIESLSSDVFENQAQIVKEVMKLQDEMKEKEGNYLHLIEEKKMLTDKVKALNKSIQNVLNDQEKFMKDVENEKEKGKSKLRSNEISFDITQQDMNRIKKNIENYHNQASEYQVQIEKIKEKMSSLNSIPKKRHRPLFL